MMNQDSCICSAPLRRKPFSAHFDALCCAQCGSKQFVAALGASVREFRYDISNDKYAQRDYLYGKELRWAHTTLLKRSWAGRKVLEVGCFNGFFLDELKKRGADVYGFDVNSDALAVGQELFGLQGRLHNRMLELAPLGPFDDILCIDVLEHLTQPEAFLRELLIMLKPEGCIAVAGPTVERRFHDKSDYPPHHKWWFSSSGLQSLLQNNGFQMGSTTTQRDGMLFLRNFIGKVFAGLHKREFYGDAVAVAPAQGGLWTACYAALRPTGRWLFTALRISYCSVILIATKVKAK